MQGYGKTRLWQQFRETENQNVNPDLANRGKSKQGIGPYRGSAYFNHQIAYNPYTLRKMDTASA